MSAPPPDAPVERHRVAVIGAGPIGLELAVALKQAGVDYVQLDAAQIGATIASYPQEMLFHSSADRLSLSGVPIQVADQQKPKREEYLAYLRSLVMQFGLEVRTYERVEHALRLPSGGFELQTRALTGPRRYHVDAVVLAIGAMHAPRLLGIPGEELPHVSHYFFDPHTYFGKKLLIVGGRNSAVETAVRCQRAGAEVTLSYRRGDFDPVSVKFWLLPEVRAMIRDARVRFLPFTTPLAIEPGKVLLATTDASAEPYPVDADFVLLMTGYRQDPTLFDLLGVDMQGADRQPLYDPETMETNVPGVFVAGTAIAGTPLRRVSVIVETCHVHIPRIVTRLTGTPVPLSIPSREDD
jgi:thioredoxin reductase (NADPH)